MRPIIDITVDTSILPNGNILQEVWQGQQDARQVMMRKVLLLSEQGVRDALIKLGWTPPPSN